MVGLLGLATLVALWRWPKIGFLGAWFFAILAPTSSIVPVATQIVAEHRMYLPLAAVVTAVTLAGYFVCCRWGSLLPRGPGFQQTVSAPGGDRFVGGSGTGVRSHRGRSDAGDLSPFSRNATITATYPSGKIRSQGPGNARAHYNLGMALAAAGRSTRPSPIFRRRWKSSPTSPRPTTTLALALADRGQVDEAIAHYQKALEIKPDFAEAHNNLGLALAGRGQVDEAIAHYRKAWKSSPTLPRPTTTLAWLWPAADRSMRPSPTIGRRWKSSPTLPRPTTTSAWLWAAADGSTRPLSIFSRRWKSNPITPRPDNNLGNALAGQGKIAEAVVQWREAVRLQPDEMRLLNDTGLVLATSPERIGPQRGGGGRVGPAGGATLRWPGAGDPRYAGRRLCRGGKISEAVQTAQKALNWPPAEQHTSGRRHASQDRALRGGIPFVRHCPTSHHALAKTMTGPSSNQCRRDRGLAVLLDDVSGWGPDCGWQRFLAYRNSFGGPFILRRRILDSTKTRQSGNFGRSGNPSARRITATPSLAGRCRTFPWQSIMR